MSFFVFRFGQRIGPRLTTFQDAVEAVQVLDRNRGATSGIDWAHHAGGPLFFTEDDLKQDRPPTYRIMEMPFITEHHGFMSSCCSAKVNGDTCTACGEHCTTLAVD